MIKEITLTPTIPIRPNFKGGYLTVTFYLPDGLWLVNKEKCFVELKGTTPVKVKVGATCTTLTGLRKSIVITPKITNGDDSMFWALFGLPTVWVCIMYVVLALLLIVILPSRRSRAKVTHTSRSVTRFLRALLLPPGWDASPSQGFPHECMWQGMGMETPTFRSEVQHANHYTTAMLKYSCLQMKYNYYYYSTNLDYAHLWSGSPQYLSSAHDRYPAIDVRPYLEVHCRFSFIACLAAILKSEAVLAVFSGFNSLEETFHD